MKRVVMLTAMLLVLSLTGCSAAAFWLSGCGDGEADLVVINNSGQSVWSITLDYENETRGVQSAWDHALLEQGQTYGLLLEADTATVTLSGRGGRELARTEINHSGERLYLTLEKDGTLSVSEEWPNV